MGRHPLTVYFAGVLRFHVPAQSSVALTCDFPILTAEFLLATLVAFERILPRYFAIVPFAIKKNKHG
jgi:hypothetical protein